MPRRGSRLMRSETKAIGRTNAAGLISGWLDQNEFAGKAKKSELAHQLSELWRTPLKGAAGCPSGMSWSSVSRGCPTMAQA